MTTDELLVRVGARVRQLRRARRLTLERLADLAELDATYLGQIERGRGNATIRVLGQIATALDVDVAALMDPHTSATEPALRRLLGQRARSLSADQLRALVRIIEALH